MAIISEEVGVIDENGNHCFNSRTFMFNKWENELLRGWSLLK